MMIRCRRGCADASVTRRSCSMLANLASYAFLAAALLAPLVAAGAAQAKTNFALPQSLLWWLARLLAQLLWNVRLARPLPLAPGQGAILVCNHKSSVDPFFIQTTTKRKTHWMVAREYCEHPAFRWFLQWSEVIPVSRGGIDTAATRTAIRFVAEGGIVGMFPEGRINMTDRFMLPGRPGAALIALKAHALIVPCYIEGSPYDRVPWSPLFLPARVTVHYGQPLDISEFFGREQEEGVLEEVLRRAMKRVAELAGRLDFAPQIAGKNWKPSQEELEADMAASQRRRRDTSHRRRIAPDSERGASVPQ